MRSGASGLSGGTGYVFGFLANKLFLKMLATLTLPGTFWFYSMVGLSGAALLYFVLPETEGRSLVEIEEHFSGGKSLNPRTNFFGTSSKPDVNESATITESACNSDIPKCVQRSMGYIVSLRTPDADSEQKYYVTKL